MMDAALAPTPMVWKDTDPLRFTIYARGHEKTEIAGILRAGAVLWLNLEAHPLGMSMTKVERDAFPSADAYKKVVALASLFIDDKRFITDPDLPGTIQVWPRRERDADGKWVTTNRWARRSLTSIANTFRNVDARFGLELKWKGTAVLVVQLPGNHYAEGLDIVKNNGLEHEKVSTPSVTTAVLMITSKQKSFGRTFDVLINERRLLEEKFPELRWGDPDPTFIGFRSTVMIPSAITLADAYTKDVDGCVVRFQTAPSQHSKEQEAANAELVKEAVEAAAGGYSEKLARHTGMGEDEDEPDPDSDAQAEINEIELDRYQAAQTKLLMFCARALGELGMEDADREAFIREAAKALPFDTGLLEEIMKNRRSTLTTAAAIFALIPRDEGSGAPSAAPESTTQQPTWRAAAMRTVPPPPVSFVSNINKPRKNVNKKPPPARQTHSPTARGAAKT
jgi:hypothetical protein